MRRRKTEVTRSRIKMEDLYDLVTQSSGVMSNALRPVIRYAYQIAETNGFHDEEKDFGMDIALIHSELSEALEAYRVDTSDEAKKELIAEELADAVIRIFDMSFSYDMNLHLHILRKMIINTTRPYKHGKTV